MFVPVSECSFVHLNTNFVEAFPPLLDGDSTDFLNCVRQDCNKPESGFRKSIIPTDRSVQEPTDCIDREDKILWWDEDHCLLFMSCYWEPL
jgi:hypothetical protein